MFRSNKCLQIQGCDQDISCVAKMGLLSYYRTTILDFSLLVLLQYSLHCISKSTIPSIIEDGSGSRTAWFDIPREKRRRYWYVFGKIIFLIIENSSTSAAKSDSRFSKRNFDYSLWGEGLRIEDTTTLTQSSHSNHLCPQTRPIVQNCVIRYLTILKRNLQRNSIRITWIRRRMAIVRYSGCIGGNDQSVLATLNPCWCCWWDCCVW